VLVPFKPTRSKVENVLDALRAVTNLPASTAAPYWLRNDPGLDPLDMLACPNGLAVQSSESSAIGRKLTTAARQDGSP
jgi:hypothetical protein